MKRNIKDIKKPEACLLTWLHRCSLDNNSAVCECDRRLSVSSIEGRLQSVHRWYIQLAGNQSDCSTREMQSWIYDGFMPYGTSFLGQLKTIPPV